MQIVQLRCSFRMHPGFCRTISLGVTPPGHECSPTRSHQPVYPCGSQYHLVAVIAKTNILQWIPAILFNAFSLTSSNVKDDIPCLGTPLISSSFLHLCADYQRLPRRILNITPEPFSLSTQLGKLPVSHTPEFPP